MLPREWPLARMSVSIRHVSVLLRVTLLRRLAELSFRGHDFVDLPREVVREVHRDVRTLLQDTLVGHSSGSLL